VCPADPNMAWVTVYESSCMFILNRGSPDTRVRPKKYLWFRFPNRPYFFLPTLLFFRCG
jgi:hypothetical protein